MNIKIKYCSVVYGQGKETVAFAKSKSGISFSLTSADVSFVLKGDSLGGTFKTKDAAHVKELVLACEITTAEQSGELALFKEGFQSWSYSGAFRYNERQRRPLAKFVVANQENTANWPTGKRGKHVSDMFLFLGSRETSKGLFVGQMPPFNQFVEYTFTFGTKNVHELIIRWDMDRLFKKNESIKLDPVVMWQGHLCDMLDDYAVDVKKKGKISFIDKLRVGWCSWYYYYTQISYDIIMENLEFSKQNKIKFDFFQIDDGYQSTVGDWLDLKPSFQDKMKPMTAAIKKAGYVPGLWVAPFICTGKSKICTEHPEWLLKDEKGNPVSAGFNPGWSGTFYALDITHPEVLAYLTDVFRVIKKEWGFDYIKLDFMYAASLPGVRYNKRMTRAEVLKMGNEFIRKEVGKKTVLLGCGMPIGQAIGYMDAMRVSCDVAPYWKMKKIEWMFQSDSMLETRGALRNSLVRTFMDKRFWINDPDCLMLRTHKTKLTPPERLSLYNGIMTIGGMLVTSDKMIEYGKEEMENLCSAISVFKKTAGGRTFSPDILRQRIPEILINDKGFCTIFNFDDEPKSKVLNISDFYPLIKKGKVGLVEQATGKRFMLDKSLSFELEAHGSLMFKFEK